MSSTQATMFDFAEQKARQVDESLEAELEAWICGPGDEPDDWHTRHRREHKEARRQTVLLYRKLRRVAELMGYTFHLEEESWSYDPQRVELREPGNPNRGYSARVDYRDGKKVKFSGLTADIHEHVYHDDHGNDTIGVSISRSAEDMVKEIYSRLRQPYRELRAKAESRKEAFDSETRRLTELIELAKQAAGPAARGGVELSQRQHQAKMSASGPGGYPAPCVDASAHLYNGEHFTLKFDRIPPDLAIRLLQEFGEHITNDKPAAD
jgi:hypothetical protein